MELTWRDSEEIGILLFEKYPKIDPLTVRFTALHQMITELPGFEDDPKGSNEGILEAVQMSWHEEYQESQE